MENSMYHLGSYFISQNKFHSTNPTLVLLDTQEKEIERWASSQSPLWQSKSKSYVSFFILILTLIRSVDISIYFFFKCTATIKIVVKSANSKLGKRQLVQHHKRITINLTYSKF